jgi:hypothetical protein
MSEKAVMVMVPSDPDLEIDISKPGNEARLIAALHRVLPHFSIVLAIMEQEHAHAMTHRYLADLVKSGEGTIETKAVDPRLRPRPARGIH